LEVKAGVPQVSIVGPFLFNLFVADLSYFVDCLKVRYADDTTLMISSSNPEDLKDTAESHLTIVSTWFKDNLLLINTAKTQIMILGSYAPEKWRDFSIDVDGITIRPELTIKLLGVVLDAQLSLEKQISSILKKAGNALRLARNVKKVLSPDLRKMLLTCYVLPHLLYCCSLLITVKKGQLSRLESFVKTAKRSLLVNDLDISISEQSNKRALIRLHQALFTGVPRSFSDNIKTSSGKYNTKTMRILLPATRTNILHNSVTFLASKLWNHLPLEMNTRKTNGSTKAFKNSLSSLTL
jgi:hypothetical protein